MSARLHTNGLAAGRTAPDLERGDQRNEFLSRTTQTSYSQDLAMAREQRQGVFSSSERRLLVALCEVALPAGRIFPAADETVITRAEQFLASLPPSVTRGYRTVIKSFQAHALARYRRQYWQLSSSDRLELIDAWRKGNSARRLAVRALLSPLKLAHFDNPDFYQAIGCVYDFSAQQESQPRYMRERVHNAADFEHGTQLDCDVVVVGSGAGGAAVAKELAELGHAVIVVEEGKYHQRSDFTGRAAAMQRKLYRNAGATFSIGNLGIPIPIGRGVGGTTAVNAGTCYRAPGRVLRKWQRDFGLRDLSVQDLAPYYDRVERVLQVAPAQDAYLGGVARVIARGCDALGYRHGPLLRNAPDCDGKGVCCFGCPTGAKRSTDVSYVPMALRAGAEIICGAHVERILTESGRAVGVVARAVGHRHKRSEITFRARAVVIACGTLITPVLLGRNGLCDSSDQLGRNLSIHPAVASMAVFNEDISSFNAIPQGYSIEEFHEEGLLYEGATTPLEVAMTALTFVGPKLIQLAERYDRVATFGFLVEDSSRGRVRVVRGRPVITYVLNDADVARLKRGVDILAQVFFAAGAASVLPMVHGFDELRSRADLARFRATSLKARDFNVSAYHPLGTARMGSDPANSVVGANHETHDVRGLYITDGSAVPSSLAVNPQMTIMALATRAAERIDTALSSSH